MGKLRFNQREMLPIGLGTWHMGDDFKKRDQEIKALQTGLANGATAIDTAEMYGEGNSEKLVGEAIKDFKRSDIYLISKVYPWNASTHQLPISLDNSLQRLGTDYLDLYLLHWTGNIPLAETVAVMEKAKAAGKIKAWGVSNFDVADMEALWEIPEGRNCVTNEVLYNLGSRGIEFDLLPWQQRHNMPLIAYSPVAQGDSLGNFFNDKAVLQEIARNHEATIFQILLAWSIRDGQTLAIPQSSQANHVLENLKASEIQLSPAELVAIDAVFPRPTSKQPLAVL